MFKRLLYCFVLSSIPAFCQTTQPVGAAFVNHCTGWKATYVEKAHEPSHLKVTGRCQLKLGNTFEFKATVPPGINPAIFLMDLSITTSPGAGSNLMRFVPVTYDEPITTKPTKVKISGGRDIPVTTLRL